MPQAKSRRVEFPMAEIESLADVAEGFTDLWRAGSNSTLTIEVVTGLDSAIDPECRS
jgi:hypothetical protein